ncbi:hypothetical protein [Kineococcus auxinigenes]|uniref:hypothetical protein n=1 Tax=unclassified Kineococcus TaxID=2621656 RepID=UPI003D7E9E73
MAHRDAPAPADPVATAPGAPARRARRPGAWGGRLLTAAVAVPPALSLETARRVLDGSLDTTFGLVDPATGMLNGPQGQAAATSAQLLAERWSLLWQLQPPHVPLLAGALGTVVLAALVLAGRPAALVPRAGARWAAAAVAGCTALAALAALAGFVAQVAGLLPQGTWLVGSPFLSHGTAVGVLVLSTALAVAAALTLLRAPGEPVDETDDEADDETGDETGDGTGDGAEDETAQAPGPATAPAAVVQEHLRTTPADHRAGGPPRPREDELALYRRPR